MSPRESRVGDHVLGPGFGVARHARAETTAVFLGATFHLCTYLLSSLKAPWPFLSLHVDSSR